MRSNFAYQNWPLSSHLTSSFDANLLITDSLVEDVEQIKINVKREHL